MTPRKTDRYVRRGGPVPQIYPGTLTCLNQAMKDTQNASRFMPELVFYLEAVSKGERHCIRVFKAGHDVTTGSAQTVK
jgi:hypothetical protein